MPTPTNRDTDPQSLFLSAVREGQTAVIDVLRVWADIGQQLTRELRLPIARIELDDAVDRAFDVAEQTLAAQRQLARTLAGLATRQADLAVDTTVETIEATTPDEMPTAEPVPPRQDRRPDGRTYEERSVEELRERAAELQIEGRASMTKDELITALRDHRRSRSGKTDAPKSQPATQDRTPDRRAYEERSLDELRERARELDVEGRSSMTKDELIAALRGQAS
jgi:Rho termination factor, N-terminal domain